MDLKVIEQDGQLVTDSRDVAEMVSIRHSDLLEKIGGSKKVTGYIQILENGKFRSQDFFIPHTYKSEQNKEMPCYLLTKQGCEMIANKMTGQKGVLFTATYVKKFNEMEQQQQPQGLELALQAALQHEREIKSIKTDVDYLKDSMRIDTLQQQDVQSTASKSVTHALGGKQSNAYQHKPVRTKAFSAFWNEFKQYFKVPRYGDLPKAKYDEALRFIQLWRPSTSLQMEIDSWNSQMTME